MRWEKAGFQAEVVNEDLVECRREAFLAAPRETWLFDPFPRTFIARDRFGRPIFVHRYWRGSDRLLREQSLVDWCMRLKGYRLVPVPPERASRAEPETGVSAY